MICALLMQKLFIVISTHRLFLDICDLLITWHFKPFKYIFYTFSCLSFFAAANEVCKQYQRLRPLSPNNQQSKELKKTLSRVMVGGTNHSSKICSAKYKRESKHFLQERFFSKSSCFAVEDFYFFRDWFHLVLMLRGKCFFLSGLRCH